MCQPEAVFLDISLRATRNTETRPSLSPGLWFLSVILRRQDWQNQYTWIIPDSKIRGANMRPIWGRQDPDGPHVGPMNFAIWYVLEWSPHPHPQPPPTCFLTAYDNMLNAFLTNSMLKVN